MKFQVVLHYDPEYKGYVVDVPELNGCMSQGKTFDDALENVKDAIHGWIEVEKYMNRPFEKKENSVFLGEVVV